MNELRTLAALELRSLYGINKIFHTSDKKARSRYRLMCGVFAFVIIMIAFYVALLIAGLCMLGLASAVPAYLTLISSLLIFVLGLFRAGNMLFAKKGYDILASMPIKRGSVVAARFFAMYIEDLLLTLLIFASGTVTYGVLLSPNWLFYVISFLGMLFVPVIPLVAATLFGTLIMAVSSRVKHKSGVQIILSLVLIIGIFALTFSLDRGSAELSEKFIAELMQGIGEMIGRLYPPSMWLGNAALGVDLWGLVIFVLISSAVGVGCVYIASVLFDRVMRGLGGTTAKHDYKIGQLKGRGILKALLIREAKRYFSSSIYVMNTIIGPILACIASGVLCFGGADMLNSILPFGATAFLPFALGLIFCMMTTTSCSISMEGKQFWTIRSLPIPQKALYDSKILLNLCIIIPCYVLSQILLTIGLKPSPTELLWQLLIPLLIILFSTVVGITVNLGMHSFDWEKEEQVVKQSAPAMIGGFAGPLVSIISGAAVMLLPAELSQYAYGAVCLILAVMTLLLYRHNNKITLEKL